MSAQAAHPADDQCMSTIEERRDEAERVYDWRFAELVRVGYSYDEAWHLASNPSVDIRVAERLLESGCPRETARRILL